MVFAHIGNPLFARNPDQGALPQLNAATDPTVRSGHLIGPDVVAEPRGTPTRVELSAAAASPETGRRLWALSEKMTGVRLTIPTPA
ncbi:hypothetical protein [Streptoalloteichus tenebrarius]|uniref:hypothetical protein n=1 Tax=Streptoalloteichus tenebrarius (strain ATCC 17920 / DSM 40477 / JCM 4838 / CBS 697.72 / NBRC 16177 / NCIMB 11028 / NRRL B-12390 / A12253. 1 / ISP 5477) TaxID=1933 RepID=UPI0020A3FADF|nr:hypothetical protein [Streptoalloteichus tenebrarius]